MTGIVVFLITFSTIIVANSNCENIWDKSFMHCTCIFETSENGTMDYDQLQNYCVTLQNDEKCQTRNIHCGSPEKIKDFKFDEPISCNEIAFSKKFDKLPSNFFYNGTTIFAETLRLEKLGIKDIEESAFFGVENVTTLFLGKNLIETIHTPVFSNLHKLKRLSLSENSIKHLGNQAFIGLGNLAYLGLDKNTLINIKDKVFKPLTSLESLTLFNTGLQNVSSNILEFLPNLDILQMQKSALNKKILTAAPHGLNLSDDSLLIPCGLESIYLNNLKLEYVDDLNCIQNLDFIDLSHNQLTDFKSTAISNLQKLDWIDLSYNRFSHLEESLFENKPKLRLLYLQHNNIKHLPNGIFKKLDTLEELRLDGNKLKELPVGVFNDLSFLHLLNISSNQLAHLDGTQHLHLTTLNELYIDHNNLACINMNVTLYSDLNTFQLQGNPWNCSSINELYAAIDIHLSH